MTQTADVKTRSLLYKLERAGISASYEQAEILRRAERTLHRWHELECGDGDSFTSWAIVRDENTGVPYMEVHPHRGPSRRTRIADREKGALERVKTVCAELGIYYYQQGDPRGGALYVSLEPIDGSTYDQGVGCWE